MTNADFERFRLHFALEHAKNRCDAALRAICAAAEARIQAQYDLARAEEQLAEAERALKELPT